MSLAIKIDIRDRATPAIQKFIDGLQSRKGLNLLVGQRAQALCRDHLIQLSQSRHDTANRLGATPSGFLGKAAEKISSPESLRDTGDGIAIALNHPGLVRAFKDVRITAGTKTPGVKFLTIPARAEAYNQTYATALRRYGVVSERTGKRVLPRAKGEKPWFVFVPSVLQKQDRTLLPSDDAIVKAALQGVNDYAGLLTSEQAKTVQ